MSRAGTTPGRGGIGCVFSGHRRAAWPAACLLVPLEVGPWARSISPTADLIAGFPPLLACLGRANLGKMSHRPTSVPTVRLAHLGELMNDVGAPSDVC